MNNCKPKVNNIFGTTIFLFVASIHCAEVFAGERGPLSSEDMSAVVGGIEVQTFSSPSNDSVFYTDNIRIDTDIRHSQAAGTILLEAYVNNAKADGVEVVTTPNGAWRYGSYDGRIDWPLGIGPADLNLRYYDSVFGSGTPSTGDNTRTNLELSTDVKVGKIIFYNTDDQNNESTAVSEETIRMLVDNRSSLYKHYVSPPPSTPATHSVDAILEQCSTATRMQFRLHSIGTHTIPASSSTRININLPYAPGQTLNDILWVDTGFEAAADAVDIGEDLLHVFFVNEFKVIYPSGTELRIDGATLPPDEGSHNKIIINTAALTDFNMASVLAHEIGHAVGGINHVDTPANPCGAEPEPSEVILSTRNNMCGTRWGGRQLNASQCSVIYNNTQIQIDDFN